MITKLLLVAAFQIVIAMLVMLMLNLWQRRSFMKRNTRRIYPKDVRGMARYMGKCTVYYRHRTVWNLFRKKETFKLSGSNYYDSNGNLVSFEEGLKWN